MESIQIAYSCSGTKRDVSELDASLLQPICNVGPLCRALLHHDAGLQGHPFLMAHFKTFHFPFCTALRHTFHPMAIRCPSTTSDSSYPQCMLHLWWCEYPRDIRSLAPISKIQDDLVGLRSSRQSHPKDIHSLSPTSALRGDHSRQLCGIPVHPMDNHCPSTISTPPVAPPLLLQWSVTQSILTPDLC